MKEEKQYPSNEQLSRIVFVGFRATGKSAVGSILADLLGYRFVDTDDEIVRQLGCSIADSVKRSGWQHFRDLEQELLSDLCRCSQTVFATGGGAVLHRDAWFKLRECFYVVWLKADTETIMARLKDDSKTASQRPPITGGDEKEEIAQLLEKRHSLYQSYSDMSLSTENQPPAELAAILFGHIRAKKV